MQTRIKTTNFELSPSLTALAEDKLSAPVLKLLSNIDKKTDIILDVELGKSTKHHKEGRIWRCEANLSLPYVRKVIRAEFLADSLTAAVDEVKYQLEREIKKFKEKIITVSRKGERSRRGNQR